MVCGGLLYLALSRPGCPVPPQGRAQTVVQMCILTRVPLSRALLIKGGPLIVVDIEGSIYAASDLPCLSLVYWPLVPAPPLGPYPIVWARIP